MTSKNCGTTLIALGLFLFGLWLLLCRSLAVHWSVSQQYSYGWMTPALMAYMVWVRWKHRPIASAPIRRGYGIAGLAALLFFPTWFVLQPNPDWRSLNWVFAAEVVAITLGFVANLGGSAWVKQFAFPCLFIFTAIPWPRPLEIPIVETLSNVVAQLGVFALNLTGVTALQHGNVIEVQTGMLGVEEACSGIQSLQATLMASIFFGEFFWLGPVRRIFLAVFGIAAALITNITRTYFLAWYASRFGVPEMEKVHDLAGNLALTACFLLVWALACFRHRSIPNPEPAAAEGRRAHCLEGKPIWVLVVWMAAVLVATEFWFHETEAIHFTWTLRPPENSEPIELSKWTADLLMADQSIARKWIDDDGYRWQAFFFQWNAGPVRSRLLAQLHRPEICLPASGAVLSKRRASIPIFIKGVRHDLNAYTFTQEGYPTFVYWGAWESRSARANQMGNLSGSLFVAALQSVMWRERNLEQRVVELAVSGCNNSDDADRALRRLFPKLVVQQE